MIKKIRNKIMNLNFGKTAKYFVIVSLIAFIAGGAALGFSFKTQIGEALSYYSTYKSGNLTTEEQNNYVQEKYDKQENGKFDEKYEKHKDKYLKKYKEEKHFKKFNFTEPTITAKIVAVTVGAIYYLIGIIYWLLIAAWLYKSASETDMNGILWGVLGLIANLGAVILFLIIRNIIPVCPVCGKYQKSGNYCKNCGSQIKFDCKSCGKKVSVTDSYCYSCGEKLKN